MNSVHDLDWCTTESDFSKAISTRDAMDVRTTLVAVTRAKPKRAAKALSVMLSHDKNKVLKKELMNLLHSEPNHTMLEHLIISGIRDSLLQHTS